MDRPTPANGGEVTVPTEVERFFDGGELDQKQHLAVYLLTVGEDGWPHSAMISAGELLLEANGVARLGLWPRSRTTANVRRSGRAVLLLVLGQRSFRIRITVRETAAPSPAPPLAFFTGRVDAVTAEQVEYAVLDSAVHFTLRDAGDTLARWHDTIRALRMLEA